MSVRVAPRHGGRPGARWSSPWRRASCARTAVRASSPSCPRSRVARAAPWFALRPPLPPAEHSPTVRSQRAHRHSDATSEQRPSQKQSSSVKGAGASSAAPSSDGVLASRKTKESLRRLVSTNAQCPSQKQGSFVLGRVWLRRGGGQ